MLDTTDPCLSVVQVIQEMMPLAVSAEYYQFQLGPSPSLELKHIKIEVLPLVTYNATRPLHYVDGVPSDQNVEKYFGLFKILTMIL